MNTAKSRLRNGLTPARENQHTKNLSKGAARIKRKKISEMSLALMAALTPHLQTCKAYWRSADSCWDDVVILSNWIKIDYGYQPPREEMQALSVFLSPPHPGFCWGVGVGRGPTTWTPCFDSSWLGSTAREGQNSHVTLALIRDSAKR